MAVRAHGRLPVALRNLLPVNALQIILGDAVVATAAGLRHIKLENGRLRILGVEDLVGAVAVRANRGLL